MTAVSHALQALSILEHKDERERPYDLVLADVHMPVMDGFKLLQRVNEEFNLPVVRKCPCIVFFFFDSVSALFLNIMSFLFIFLPIE